MPKSPDLPAKAGSTLSLPVGAKPKGFDPASIKRLKHLHGAKLTMKKNLRPGKSGQR
jgi:hypothetical protein